MAEAFKCDICDNFFTEKSDCHKELKIQKEGRRVTLKYRIYIDAIEAIPFSTDLIEIPDVCPKCYAKIIELTHPYKKRSTSIIDTRKNTKPDTSDSDHTT
jgi:hypothetical protein